ncbi:DNA polymerase zeta, partial [Bonamia ostreae]
GEMINDETANDFARNLNKALKTSFSADKELNICKNFINKLTIFRAKSIYGFNKKSDFLKIEFVNTKITKKIEHLYENNNIQENWTLFESHIDFELKFLIDFGLSGFSNISLNNFSFRCPLPKSKNPSTKKWDEGNIKAVERKNGLKKTTFCELEIDTDANLLKRKSFDCKEFSNVINSDQLLVETLKNSHFPNRFTQRKKLTNTQHFEKIKKILAKEYNSLSQISLNGNSKFSGKMANYNDEFIK